MTIARWRFCTLVSNPKQSPLYYIVESYPFTYVKSGLVQLWYNSLAVGADELALIASHIMDMHLGKAKIEEALDVLSMFIKIRRDENPPLEIFGAHQLPEGGEIFG